MPANNGHLAHCAHCLKALGSRGFLSVPAIMDTLPYHLPLHTEEILDGMDNLGLKSSIPML